MSMPVADPLKAARPDPTLLKKRSAGRSFFWLAVWMFGLLVIFGFPYYFILRSGLFLLPGYAWVYRPPVPMRVIRATTPLSLADVSRRIQYQLQRGVTAHPTEPRQTVVLTEEELSAALWGAAVPLLAQQGIRTETLQITSDANGVELFARLSRDRIHVDFLMQAHVRLESGQIRFYPGRVQLGGWHPSLSVFHWLLRAFLGYDTSTLAFSVSSIPIEGLRFYPRFVELTVRLPRAP